jgi:signal peptidase II
MKKNRTSWLFSQPKLLLALTALFVWVTVAFDQMMKGWASDLIAPVDFLCFRFFPYGNSGVFGGYLAELDPWVIRIFFSVLAGFLALGIALLLYFLRPKNAPILKAGLVVYVAGIFGNVWDRMTTGTIVDYAVIRLPGLSGMAFNFADAVVFVGALLIAVAIFREANVLWYAKDQRQGYWVSPGFQTGFALALALLAFAHFCVIALYSFVYLKVYVASGATNPLGPERIIHDYLGGLAVIEGAALVLTVAGSVVFSHRLVGPLLAFGQFVDRRKRAAPDAPVARFRAREADYFKDILEGIADRLD